jgi:hypothetical protein
LRASAAQSTVDGRNCGPSRAPEGEARYRDGVLGIDALRAGFTLDFRAMQFRLE